MPLDMADGVFEYTRRDLMLTGQTYRYEWSTSLESDDWTSFVPELEIPDGASPIETVQVTIGASLPAGSRMFYAW
jgi:hypothetical protein